MPGPYPPPEPPIPITINHQPLTLSAGAYSTVTRGDYPPEFSGSIGVVVSVSNADGSPRTDLSEEDFKVQLFSQDASPAATQFKLLAPLPIPSHAYLLVAWPIPKDSWINGTYVVLVEVSHNLFYDLIATGRTVTTAQVSFPIY